MTYHAKLPADPADAAYARCVPPLDALHVTCADDVNIRKRAKQLTLETSRATGEIVLLTGAPMSGRSEKVRMLAGAPWLAPTFRPDGTKTTPFVAIDARAQAQADKWTIVDAIAGVADGQKASRVQHDRRRLQYAVNGIQNSGHRLIAITNADQIVRGKRVTELDEVAGRLSLLAAETGASFILTGGDELLRFVCDRPDLIGSASSHFPMQPIKGDDEFAGILTAFEKAGDLEHNPELREPALVGVLMDLTRSLHGRAAHLLREAAKAAKFDDVDMISVDHLSKIVDRTVGSGENPLVDFT